MKSLEGIEGQGKFNLRDKVDDLLTVIYRIQLVKSGSLFSMRSEGWVWKG